VTTETPTLPRGLALLVTGLLAAWARRDGRTWFFKLTGPNAAVEKEKPKFVKFLQSVRF